MNNKILILIAVVVAAVVAAAVLLNKKNSSVLPVTNNAANTNNQDALNSLESKVNHLTDLMEQSSNRQSRFEQWVEQELNKKSKPESQQVEQQAAEPVDPVQQMAERQAKYQEMMQARDLKLQQAMQVEVTGADGWADSTKASIDTMFVETPEFSAGSLASSECVDKLCKIEILFTKDKSTEEQEMFENHFLTKMGKTLPRATARNEIMADGTIKRTYYMARKGEYLPTESGPSKSRQSNLPN